MQQPREFHGSQAPDSLASVALHFLSVVPKRGRVTARFLRDVSSFGLVSYAAGCFPDFFLLSTV